MVYPGHFDWQLYTAQNLKAWTVLCGCDFTSIRFAHLFAGGLESQHCHSLRPALSLFTEGDADGVGWGNYGGGLPHCLLDAWSVCLPAVTAEEILLQRKFRRAAQYQETDADVLDLLHEISREAGYSGPVAVAVSAKATTAYQAGFIRPYIVLPHTIDTFSSADIRNMLRHELCHFLGGDLWIKVGLQIMSCLLWWNPAVILLRRNAEQMLELRCDRRACASLTAEEQVSYLDTLLRLLSDERPEAFKVSMEYSGSAEETEILQRFQMILQGKTQTRSKLMTAMGCLLCAILFVASYLVILQPWTVPADEQTGMYGEVAMAPGDSYILLEPDGTLQFYCNGTCYGEVEEKTLGKDPFNKLPILTQKDD